MKVDTEHPIFTEVSIHKSNGWATVLYRSTYMSVNVATDLNTGLLRLSRLFKNSNAPATLIYSGLPGFVYISLEMPALHIVVPGFKFLFCSIF